MYTCLRFLLLVSSAAIALVLSALAAPAEAQDAPERVRVREGELTLPTYDLLPDDPNPQFRETDGSIVYPYTMQDNLGSERRPRVWRAFFLENEYLEVACLPEIGGRIQWVLDKRRNEQMFYDNRVIRPGLIALRGAWVSGGIEWNRGPQGHTVTSYSPVNVTGVENEDGSATLVIGEVEQTFRTGWEVRLTLRPGVARLDEAIRLFNPTPLPHPYYFWNNTAFPQRPGTRFIYPMSLASDHFGTTFYRWPENDGVDLTRLPNYPEPTSIFAYRSVADFFGAYDSGTDRGIVQTADHRELPGKKGWTWGQGDDGAVNQRALTDEDGPYIEVQSGPLPTQSDYAWLHPGQTVSWEEQWTPVFGLGEGFEYATPDLVVERVSGDGGDRFLFLASRALPAAAITLGSGDAAETRRADLTPESVFAFSTAEGGSGFSARPGEPVEVEVSWRGETVLAYRSPLRIPVEEPPPLPEPVEPATAEAAFAAGERADKALDRAAARGLYERALAFASDHADAAVASAVLDLKAARFEEAADRLAAVVEADPEHGRARFLHGVARFQLDDFPGALDSAMLATRLAGVEAVAWRLAGRARMRLGEPRRAAAAFARAEAAGDRPRSAELRHLALFAAGDREAAAAWADERIAAGTIRLAPWALRLLTAENPERRAAAARSLSALAGEPDYAVTELLTGLASLGLADSALDLLDALRAEGFAPSPTLWFHAAAWADTPADRDRFLDRALDAPLEHVFPSRPESLPVLRAAADRRPAAAAPRLLLGHLLGALGRYEEAAVAWEAAAQLDPGLSTAHRSLAMFHWKIEDRPAAAERRFRLARAARPDDQTLARDHARLLLASGRPAAAAEALAPFRSGARRRHDVTIELARALNATGRFDETVAMLDAAEVNFREGDATIWRLFSEAHLELGRRALAESDPAAALTHFDRALTYPESLGVGRPHRPAEARARWFRAEALRALGRDTEAAAALAACAEGHEFPDGPFADEQSLYLHRCAAAR